MSGPLQGIRVLEMVGIGPGPFCGMMLADMGADVIRVDRPGGKRSVVLDGTTPAQDSLRYDVTARGKRTVAIDLKSAEGAQQVLALVEQADVLIEGFRPGVMERLGLGPEVCLQRNPKLVFGRMTGWGQSGPLAQAAGHDINYISISGMFGAMGRAEEAPPPPLNLVGDLGGGAMMLAFGVACALVEVRNSGKGQVIDAAMTDGTALLGAMFYGLQAQGKWSARRGSNLLDGSAHFYDTYECADGKYIAIGSIEPQFYAELLKRIEITDPVFSHQFEPRHWPELKRRLAAHFVTRTRVQWTELLEGTDACFAPVLDMDEAPQHEHNVARNTFIEIEGVVQPAPAPRFSRTVPEVQRSAEGQDASLDEVLGGWRNTSR
jgi:alpha-methylacyl-CoA racemase